MNPLIFSPFGIPTTVKMLLSPVMVEVLEVVYVPDWQWVGVNQVLF